MSREMTEVHIFWENLEKVRNTLLLNEFEFAEHLDLSGEFYKATRKRQHFLPLSCLVELASIYGFSPEDLLTSDFDLSTIIDIDNSRNTLGERYSYATFSTTIPILNIINYIEFKKGISVKVDVFKRFGLSPSCFYDSTLKTNLHLISDINFYLKSYHGLQDIEFRLMGEQFVKIMRRTKLEAPFKEARTLQDIMSIFIEVISGQLDQNYHYQIQKMTKDFAILDTVPRKRLIEELGVPADRISNEVTCLTKMGLMASVTSLYNGTKAKITKIDSLFSGGTSNKYLIDFSSCNSKLQ